MNAVKPIEASSVKPGSFFSVFVGAQTDDIAMCSKMKELLKTVYTVFRISKMDIEGFVLLENAVACTEISFRGKECPEMWNYYYQLGVVLRDLNQDDLATACQFLYFNYQNRSRRSWPPARARKKLDQSEKTTASDLEALLPILDLDKNASSEDTRPGIKRFV